MFIDGLLVRTHTPMVTLPEHATLIDAAALLHAGTDLVVVCDAAGLLCGVVSKTDVVKVISQCQGAACLATVASLMTREVLYCFKSDPLDKVWAQIKARRLKNIPAVDAQLRPIGLIRARDVLEALLDETSEETTLLRDYVLGIGYQ